MSPEAQRLADECKRLVVRYGTTWMRCDRDALEYAIDQLASMIPAGGLAEEARDAARWRSVRDATGDLAASAKYAVSAATASEENRIADAIIAARKSKEQPR